jgi:UDP-GlcNAc:undecaprenyl-phosphate GlcNAc-1-phosphate transferase
VAVVAAAHLALLAVLLVGGSEPQAPGLGGLLAAGGLVVGLGVYDDLRWAGAPLKFTVQVGAALLAARSGWRIETIVLPGLAPLHLGGLATPVTVVWLIGTSNALNLVDGLDGLAAGLALIAAAALGVVASLHGDLPTGLLLAAVAGAAAGFLPWNRFPASVFLGDSGALWLGFMLGAASLRAASPAPGALAALVPVLALAVPLADTAFALVRRLAALRNPFKGDLRHLHHRLLAAGVEHPKAVQRLHLVAALLAATGVALDALTGWR